MATRDVILRALQDWRWSNEAPLYLQSALNRHELGLLADVAAGAAAQEIERLKEVVEAARELVANDYLLDDRAALIAAGHRVSAALTALDPQPVGTRDEAEACGRRSGLGEVG